MPFVNTEYFKDYTSVAKQFRPFDQYLADEKFVWGTQFNRVSVELNRYLVVSLLAFAFAAACLGRRLERRTTRFLLGALAFFVYLQLPISNWFYVHVPGASYLQFPWRLNAFMTPILIALLVVVAQSCTEVSSRARIISYAGLGLCLLLSLDFPRRALRLDYPRVSASELTTRLAALSDDVAGVEYLPKGVNPPAPVARKGKGKGKGKRRRRQEARIDSWDSSLVPARPLVSGDCNQDWPTVFSGRSLVLDVTLTSECRVTVRQFRSPVLALKLRNADLIDGPAEEGYSILLRAGHARVTLRQKGVLRLAREYFSERR
jgi:hypothetical protein